jgi:hypothetical protein
LSSKIIAVDFDGVVNPYGRGWQGGALYEDHTTPGWWAWLGRVTAAGFRVVIHSSRFDSRKAEEEAIRWLEDCFRRECGPHEVGLLAGLEFSAVKPPAWITVDDRCVRFDGDWEAVNLRPEVLAAFRPWTQRRHGD